MPSGQPTAILIHAAAPVKPALGAACNGCGICCATEPCPVSMVALLQFKGVCRALLWQAEEQRYVCGMVVRPSDYVGWLPTRFDAWAGRLAARRIAAGQGCDADFLELP
ncbi:MAG: hypothetical protein HY847_01240 [Betaproteobacteria bacterium]|nr:hypothetical protein [Betaproteobacteria bacterium]